MHALSFTSMYVCVDLHECLLVRYVVDVRVRYVGVTLVRYVVNVLRYVIDVCVRCVGDLLVDI